MDKFNLEAQYQKYLELMRLDEKQMPPIQQQETRRAFFGACGQMLRLMTEDIADLEEVEAVGTIINLKNQVSEYFMKQLEQL
ncbi:hypothetical protein WAF17_21010 [Bernardetia sp. ABR2-2B]|uniref:hypothetical protein n=1 Tax=Bernardetia sp. ABR2-2B TaxID=3127472 RepID=UPI0030D12A81